MEDGIRDRIKDGIKDEAVAGLDLGAGARRILGMDIGGTNLRMGLVDETLIVSALEVIPARQVYEADDTPQALGAVILDYIRRNSNGRVPVMVAAGFPSVVDRHRRRLYSSTNFPGLDGVDIVEALEDRLGIPVIIDHDAYYLLANDIWQLKLPSEGAVAGFYFGTGMGNAIYINGRPFIGKNGTAAEVGHIQMGLEQRPCSCGNKGCVEMYCCGKALEQLQKAHFPHTGIGDLFTQWGHTQVLDEFVQAMSIPVVAEINILDPEAVVIGGGIVQMKSFPREKLVRCILEHTRKPYPAENLQIYFSQPSPANGIVGAAIAGFKKIGMEMG